MDNKKKISEITEEQWKFIVTKIFEFEANDFHIQSDACWCRKTITKERLRMSFDLNDYNFIHYWTDFTDEHKKLAPPMCKIIKLIDWFRANGFGLEN